MKIKWEPANGVSIAEERRDSWAAELLDMVGKRSDVAFQRSGDSIVIISTDSDGDVTIIDAQIRRRGEVES